MKFTAALWDQDRAQLIFQTDLIDPTTEQSHCMAMTGVGNLEHAQTVVEEFRAFSPNLKLDVEQSRFGLLKSNGPTCGGSGFSPMEEAAEARHRAAEATGHPEDCECVACGMVPAASKKLNIRVKPKSKASDHETWERPYTRHYGDLDPADSFDPDD